MSDPELAFAEELASLLHPRGAASLEYITAEMQPFSNAQRPDVVWTPNAGGYAGQIFFFEIKLSTKPILLGRGFRNLVDNLNFATEALERAITRYVFITSANVPEFSERLLSENKVHVIASVSTPEAVLSYLRQIGALA
jgi:hypothetical protein